MSFDLLWYLEIYCALATDMLKLIHDSRLTDGTNVKTSSSSEQISWDMLTHKHDRHLIDGVSVKNSSTSKRE